MATLKGSTQIGGDLFVQGLTRSQSGFTTAQHKALLVADSITSRKNKLLKLADDHNAADQLDAASVALSLIADSGTTVTIGTSVGSHTLDVNSALYLYDTTTPTPYKILLTAGKRSSAGTFTFPTAVTSGTLATTNNAATWSAEQTHNADIKMGTNFELKGNASTASKLKASVNINSTAFDGSANITVPLNTAVLDAASTASYYVPFVEAVGDKAAKIHNGSTNEGKALIYDPYTGTLKATIFEGNLAGAGVVAINAVNLTGTSAFSVPYQTSTAQMGQGDSGFLTTAYVRANKTSTKKFLMMSGDGTNGTAPSWDTLGDITTGATWQATTIAVEFGGTGLKTLTQNRIYKGAGAATIVESSILDNGSTVSLTAGVSFSMPTGASTFQHIHSSNAATTSFAVFHQGAKTKSFEAFKLSNTATSSTASIAKKALVVESVDSWNGNGSINYAIHASATGGKENYAFYGEDGLFYNFGNGKFAGALEVSGALSTGSINGHKLEAIGVTGIKLVNKAISGRVLTSHVDLTVGAETTHIGAVTIRSGGTSPTVIEGPNNDTVILVSGTMVPTTRTVAGKALSANVVLDTLTLATSGAGLSGSATYAGSSASAFTVSINSTAANTKETVVYRDANKSFKASKISLDEELYLGNDEGVVLAYDSSKKVLNFNFVG